MNDQLASQITRRTFCKQTVATAAVAATAQVVAGEEQEIEETIDCHPHFYDPTRKQGVPWPPGRVRFIARCCLNIYGQSKNHVY